LHFGSRPCLSPPQQNGSSPASPNLNAPPPSTATSPRWPPPADACGSPQPICTLASLTWRIVLALVVATIGRQIIVNSFHIYIGHTFAAWSTTNGPFRPSSMGAILYYITQTLWFVLPFAAVRYGVRDRFVQLTFAVAVGTTVAFFFIPFASLLCIAVIVALAAAAIASAAWRKPLAVLFCTVATAFLAIPAVSAIDARILNYHFGGSAGRFFVHYGLMVAFRSSLLAVAIVCSILHARLVRPRLAGVANA
jgi:hypothetical protein